MEKKEKKADLEQLLNSLVKAGWKPRGKDQKFEIWIENLPYKKLRVCLKKPDYDYYVYSYRDLTSKESGLWQFCEENKMLIGFSPRRRTKNAEDCYGLVRGDIEYWGHNYQYRLIESSLKEESELEDFLLNSIKLD